MLHTILTSKTSHNDQKPLHKQHHLISYCLVHKSDLSGHRQSIIISGGEWRKCLSVISWNRANNNRCRFRQLTTALFGKITLRYRCYKYYYGVCSSTHSRQICRLLCVARSSSEYLGSWQIWHQKSAWGGSSNGTASTSTIGALLHAIPRTSITEADDWVVQMAMMQAGQLFRPVLRMMFIRDWQLYLGSSAMQQHKIDSIATSLIG